MKLYGHRNGRALRALWALEEVGARYEYVEVDLMRGEGRKPWFLGINPAGKVPVLDDGGRLITESAAICMHLAEKYPQSRLMPLPGTLQRSECYKWTSYGPHGARRAAVDHSQASIRPAEGAPGSGSDRNGALPRREPGALSGRPYGPRRIRTGVRQGECFGG
jgi:glutathione S-transferase